MPTVFTHPVAALSLATFSKRRPTLPLIVAGSVCTILPDADVVAFALDIPYEHPLGHRGFSHSLLFAVLLGVAVTWLWRRLVDPDRPAFGLFSYFALVTASHGLLDALTDGGRGVGFFIPFEDSRYFLPWQPIQVSPIGAVGFFDRGGPVLLSEFWCVWLPACGLTVIGWLHSRRARGSVAPANRTET